MNCVILTILSHFSSDRLRFFSIVNKCIYINIFFKKKKIMKEKISLYGSECESFM